MSTELTFDIEKMVLNT